MSITVRPARSSDTQTVARLVHALLCELSGSPANSVDIHYLTEAAENLLGQDGSVWAFLAVNEEGHPIGVLTLNECAAIYAGGKFGEISEFYVSPESRSVGVGPQLLEAAVRFGRDRSWNRLEVGAPSMPRWSRTVGFYLSNGFEEVGPRLRFRLA
ncbi:MAG: GNAT family N-acetyltransferase [Burkholderiaceae bacterium]